MDAESALALAHRRFPNLAAAAILGGAAPGRTSTQLVCVVRALRFWRRVENQNPAVHSHDLRQAIGNVSLGATIAAAFTLGFPVHEWFGVTDYAPHALVGVEEVARRAFAAVLARPYSRH